MYPASGIKLISPVLGLTCHSPSPGTSKPITSPSASVTTETAPAGITILTVVGSMVPSGSLSFEATSTPTVAPGVLAELVSSTATGGSASYMIVTVAVLEVLPSLSSTVYSIGVGSDVNGPVQVASGTPAAVHGAKLISPVVVFTVQTPSPATTNGSPGLAVPTICTVAGSKVPSGSLSLPKTSTITVSPVMFMLEASSTATGGSGVNSTVTVAGSEVFPSSS